MKLLIICLALIGVKLVQSEQPDYCPWVPITCRNNRDVHKFLNRIIERLSEGESQRDAFEKLRTTDRFEICDFLKCKCTPGCSKPKYSSYNAFQRLCLKVRMYCRVDPPILKCFLEKNKDKFFQAVPEAATEFKQNILNNWNQLVATKSENFYEGVCNPFLNHCEPFL